MTNKTIQHSGNVVFAVITPDGPAVYPSLGLLAEAIRSDSVEVHEGDQEYYDGREWFDVTASDLETVGLKQEHPGGCSCGSPECPEWQQSQVGIND